ncbi:unnamed protein product [Gongylonema pulchrum]|uniref:tRNA-intron lyase n=1 Tax=Gongylonema pulchrum TaxID=637853 RepID=A0A183EJL8_9BILA|nr:unnamed protein product [Gongylonema pulchrum]
MQSDAQETPKIPGEATKCPSFTKIPEDTTFQPQQITIPTKHATHPIRIEYLNSQFLVFDAVAAQEIVKKCRIIVEASGVCPDNRADCTKSGTPFILMPEQAAVLVEYAEEINDVMKELAEAASTSEPREIWQTPLYDIREEAYEEMKRPPFPENSNFRIRLNTFRDLWRRGYYLTCGLKFGCDYLAYEAIPGEVSENSVKFNPSFMNCVISESHSSIDDLSVHIALTLRFEGAF